VQLDVLQRIHDAGVIHRDLSLKNCCLLSDGAAHVGLIDFGISNFCHSIPPDTKEAPLGSINYMSLHAQSDECASHPRGKADDLESLGYVLVDLRLGSLPWSDACISETLRMKRRITTAKLCEGLPGTLISGGSVVTLLVKQESLYSSSISAEGAQRSLTFVLPMMT
jgi:serine/threonine protein kinase